MELGLTAKKLSESICSRKLQAPVILALESLRPIRGIGLQLFLTAEPFLNFILGAEFCRSIRELLKDEESFNLFLKGLDQNGD